jgi:hypothetical protein
LGRLESFPVEFLFDLRVIGEENDFSGFLGDGPYEVCTFAVYRAEAGIFDFQDTVGHFSHLWGVSVVSVEYSYIIRHCILGIEHGFDIGPGEVIRVDDLVGVATEDKIACCFEGFQQEEELGIGEVLYFVHDDEVVFR